MMKSTHILYPAGATSGQSTIVLARRLPEEGLAALVTEVTPFHPVDHRWPDQPGDTGAIEIAGATLEVVDTITAAAAQESDAVFFGTAIEAPRGAAGWNWLVAHIVRVAADWEPSMLMGQSALLQVNAGRRRLLNASHTASHLFSFAFNLHTKRFWKGLASRRDSIGNPNVDQLSIESSRIFETESIDHYRFGKTMKKTGFDTTGFLTAADEVMGQINSTLAQWIAAGGEIAIQSDGPQLEDRRFWICRLPIGAGRMACGGTHLASLSELESTTVRLERLPGAPEIRVHTEPRLRA